MKMTRFYSCQYLAYSHEARIIGAICNTAAHIVQSGAQYLRRVREREGLLHLVP